MAQEIGIEPKNVEAARAEIERTRERLSSTIDEIEGILVQKKEDIRNKLDVVSRIREKPLQAAGIVLGAGLLMGFLTGGNGADHRRRLDDEERAALWEERARRLLAIARDQEADLEELEAGAGGYGTLVYDDLDLDDWDEEPSRWRERKDAVVEHIVSFAANMARDFLTELRKRS